MDILYHKRRLKANKLRRQICATRTLLQRLRVLIALIMTVGFCFFIIWVLRLSQWYIDSTKLINLDPSIISIQGNNITPNEKILNMVNKTEIPYTQIYRLDTNPLKENIETLQPIKSVYIKRYWFPARLAIAVEERTPVFVLAPTLEAEPNSALTSDGILIDKEYLPFKTPIKAKKILTYGIRNGVDEVWDKKRIELLLECTKAFESYSGLEIKYIDLRNQKDAYVMLGDYLIRFGEFNDTALARIKWIAPVIPEAEKTKNNIKYIDLRWENSVYFCLKSSKESQQNQEIKTNSLTEQKNESKKEEKKVLKPSMNEGQNEPTLEETQEH